MKNLYSRSDLLELLKNSHYALEKLTNRHGCSFSMAVVLVDCENALKNHAQKIERCSINGGIEISKIVH